MAFKIDYSALRAQTIGTGVDEEAVTVNTRALIDKVLARYSGEWTVLRELLQNAADATASRVKIEFSTTPSATMLLPQAGTPASLIQHNILHHTLKRLVVTNNGQPFKESDWSRLKRIAEGNPDETKIGAFGVGFYSVFSDCEEPFVSSGDEAMAFYWKGNSLFTRRSKLKKEQASSDTAFVLDYRNTTSPVPPLLPLAQFLSSSLTFVNLSEIELWLDDWKILSLTKLTTPGYNVDIPRALNTKTSEGLMRINSVLHETVQMEAKWLNILGWKPKQPESQEKSANQPPSLRTFFSKFSSSSNNSSAIAKAARDERAAQEALLNDLMGEKRAVVFLQVSTASLTTSISKSFGQELERATKKPAPKTTNLAVLTATLEAGGSSSADQYTTQSSQIFASVLPAKSGRIYIGFPTHSTTGLAAHVSAPSVIPTVERESIDLNARWVKTWNQEMLRATGILCRIAWTASIGSIRDSLSRSTSNAGRSRVTSADIEKVTPQAVDLLNQFTFHESTPSAQVGNLIEEAFWTCNSSSSIEILSSRGIMKSQHVRLATDELSFVNGIPVVPSAIFEKAKGFVQRLIDYGIITEVTAGDIRKELEDQALNTKQALEFLQWLSHKTRVNEMDLAAVNSLLGVTVINDEEDHKVVALGMITQFLNAAKIPATMPVPDTTISFKLTKGLERSDLERLGWTDLQIVPWLRFLIENVGGRGQLKDSEDLLHSPEFASSVLGVVSKQWDGLGVSSKGTVIDLLGSRTTMPTKLGMRIPSAAYFPSVKLFDDLPIITVHAVKEKLLVALGVRKTIELDLIFQRLLTPEKTSSSATWSHVELIKYLASVQKDIPKSDIAKLQNAAICSAEASGAGSERRYRVSDLFQPSDSTRALGLPVLQWPSLFRENSDEGRFLRLLKLRKHPTEVELIRTIVTAHANQDLTLREKALRYLMEFFHQHQYSTAAIIDTKAAFLPVEGQLKKLASPAGCFTNDKAAAMGFDILRRDLEQHATKLGVSANPPIQDCVIWLIRNKPQTHREARQLFEMFASRLNELHGQPLQTLSEAEIVPITTRAASKSEKETSSTVKHISPSLCFLGSGDSKYADIFDYVDYGPEANSFLLRCGSKHEPTTAELAAIVVREPARIFGVFGSPERYLDLMMTLTRSWSSLKKDKTLVRDMKRSAFLLASTEFAAENPKPKLIEVDDIYDEDDATIKTYQLARPESITIADDVINYNLFKSNVLSAPPFEELESFYASLGSVSLSSIVDEKPRVGTTLGDQRPATQLQRLVQERIKLLFHDIPKDQIRHDATWIEKNLSFVAVGSISVRKTLTGRNISHVEDTTAIALNHPRLGMTIFFTPGTRDFFNVSQALLNICLHRPKPQQALILTTLLETDLLKLRTRGYDVSRILRKRAHEARVAEEQRQQQLEEEQKRLQEAKATVKHQQSLQAAPEQSPVPMPGQFPDTTNSHDSGTRDLMQEHERLSGRTPRGLFSSLSRTLGIPESSRNPTPQPPSIPEMPKPPMIAGEVQAPQAVTSPESLQQNLLNAIKASRSHNSTSVMTDPAVNEVKETQSFCDAKPRQDIEFAGESAPGIKIFLPRTLSDKVRFMEANASALNLFANILLSVAETLHLPRQSLHVFYEKNSSTIAFNSNRALFFNYKYFETLHLPDVQQGKTSDALVYWWVTTCHELAHNLVGDHSAAHSFYTESFVAQYFSRLAQKLGTRTSTKEPPPPSYFERS